MDGRRFDALAKSLVLTGSRRGAMRALAGLGLGVAGRLWPERGRQAGAACLPHGEPCKGYSQCCSKVCNKRSGTCICLKGDQPCTTNDACCSGVCNRRTGRCACTETGKSCSAATAHGCCSGTCAAVDAKGCDLKGKRCCLPLNATCEEDCECCGDDSGETGCFQVNAANSCCLRAGSHHCGSGRPCCGAGKGVKCLPSVVGSYCCLPLGSSCTFNSQCCVTKGHRCLDGICKSCGNTGHSCGSDLSCCGNLICFNSKCQECRKLGQSCAHNDDCCNALECTNQIGQTCSFNEQCSCKAR